MAMSQPPGVCGRRIISPPLCHFNPRGNDHFATDKTRFFPHCPACLKWGFRLVSGQMLQTNSHSHQFGCFLWCGWHKTSHVCGGVFFPNRWICKPSNWFLRMVLLGQSDCQNCMCLTSQLRPNNTVFKEESPSQGKKQYCLCLVPGDSRSVNLVFCSGLMLELSFECREHWSLKSRKNKVSC